MAALCLGLPALRSLRWVGGWVGLWDGGRCMGTVTMKQHPVRAFASFAELSRPGMHACSLEITQVREGDMEAAVNMLCALTGLTGLRMGFSAWPEWHGGDCIWEYLFTQVPSLADLAQLSELCLNAVSLPRDWRQLSNLRRLSWHDICHRENDEAGWTDHTPEGAGAATR